MPSGKVEFACSFRRRSDVANMYITQHPNTQAIVLPQPAIHFHRPHRHWCYMYTVDCTGWAASIDILNASQQDISHLGDAVNMQINLAAQHGRLNNIYTRHHMLALTVHRMHSNTNIWQHVERSCV